MLSSCWHFLHLGFIFVLLRQVTSENNSNGDGPIVDLGYAKYQGYRDESTGLHIFKGMRYAAPPIGKLRWQAPQAPERESNSILSATSFSSICPQNPSNGMFIPFPPGNEDCLFLNVYAPPNPTETLPVFVYIHGGGYGMGEAITTDLSQFVSANRDRFIGVTLQYRLGAFGFLASDSVYRNGALNAGVLDVEFALKWVQKHISVFGGDPSRVTISGESAGAGIVMLLNTAYGGELGNSLFVNSHAASPFFPYQFGYKDPVPTALFEAFAAAADCRNDSGTVTFDCLVEKDTSVLQNASATISASGLYGSWAFQPVVDGNLVRDISSRLLAKKTLNGDNLLVGANADEGVPFVPRNISTDDELRNWIHRHLPSFSDSDLKELLSYYPASDTADDQDAPRYATNGWSGLTANEVSPVASGHQQRAMNIYAEMTFVCPSQWMAESYSGLPGKASYKYQYSVPTAAHVADVYAYFGPAQANQGPEFVQAFREILGNFIVSSNPSISPVTARGISVYSRVQDTEQHPASDWPAYSPLSPFQMNLNQTGGTFIEGNSFGFPTAEFGGPDLRNDITLVNAYEWEGMRGARCDFWKRKAAKIPI